MFNIDVTKCRRKPIIRKFKNGIYCQLMSNKNIVWYFNGSFYLGEWSTELSSEAEKNGFGF
jgi:lysozyme family protein